MEVIFKPKDIRLSFQKFSDYANDILRSDRVTFGTRLEIFIDHCKNDPVMKVIWSQIMSIDADAIKWWDETSQKGGSMNGSTPFLLPVDEEKRDALLFRICIAINDNKIDFEKFCMAFFDETNYNAMVARFNEAVFRPMFRSLGYKIDELIKSILTLDKDSTVPVEQLNIFQSITYINGNFKAKGDVVNKNIIIEGDVKADGDVTIGHNPRITKPGQKNSNILVGAVGSIITLLGIISKLELTGQYADPISVGFVIIGLGLLAFVIYRIIKM